MTQDIDPDFIARATVAQIPMPDDRRAPETDALASLLRTALDDARRAGIDDHELAFEMKCWASLKRRGLIAAYARGA